MSMQLPTAQATADTLHAARSLIEERGWIQGAWTDKLGHLCVTQAIRLAAKTTASSISERVHRDILARLALCRFVGREPLIWNDTPDRTQQEVLDALKGAVQRVI